MSGSASDVSEFSEAPSQMIPSFLPPGELLGWNLTVVPNSTTKKNEYMYTVSVQTVGAFRSCDERVVMVNCDGPCGNKLPSTHLIAMGKCDHLLCKACYGLVKNADGSYGCSNFYCWAEPRENFRKEKANYRQIINKQICRARKLKREGEDVKTCSETNLPQTPSGEKGRKSSQSRSLSTDADSTRRSKK
ncbi:unnamed protein product [Caenorhabditis sp. 36 PRJEB53466]|nr:unnamed protein product [Caenorhabditis sp. 36 PRJEB53466]